MKFDIETGMILPWSSPPLMARCGRAGPSASGGDSPALRKKSKRRQPDYDRGGKRERLWGCARCAGRLGRGNDQVSLNPAARTENLSMLRQLQRQQAYELFDDDTRGPGYVPTVGDESILAPMSLEAGGSS